MTITAQHADTWVGALAARIRQARADLGEVAEGWDVEDTLTGVTIVCPDNFRLDLDHAAPADAQDTAMRTLRKHHFRRIETAIAARTARATKTTNGTRHQEALMRAAGVPNDPEPTLEDVLRYWPVPRHWDMTITPQVAQVLLAYNTRNFRAQSDAEIRKHAAQLREGIALYTHQGVALTWDVDNDRPELVDGQTRLAAIVRADVPWRMQITVGLDPRVRGVVDQPRRRTVAQVLNADNVPNAATIAATARLVYQYRTPGIDPRHTRVWISPLTVENMVNDDRDMYIAAAEWGRRYAGRKAGAPNGNRAAAAAAVYLMWERCGRLPEDVALRDPLDSSAHLVYDFMTKVLYGEQVSRTDPPYMLRAWIASNHAAGRTGEITKAWMELAVWIKSWNAFAGGSDRSRGAQYYTLYNNENYPQILLPDMEGLRLAARGGRR